MRYKLGDSVWFWGMKATIVKLWGDSVLNGEQIVSVKVNSHLITTANASILKPVVRCYAKVGGY